MWLPKKNKLNNKSEAIGLLESELTHRRIIPYSDLLNWVEKDTKQSFNLTGNSGINYQLEFFAIWDDKALKTIRFWGNIDGGEISAYRPLSRTYIKAHDDSFIGE